MEYAVCTVAAAPVRREDSHRSEMVNQLLFGDTMEVLELKGEWLRIRSCYDDYEGWLTHHLVTAIDPSMAVAEPVYIAKGLVNPITLTDRLIHVPMGSPLTGFDEETRLLWDEQYKYHGTYCNLKKTRGPELLSQLVHEWLSAPYLWGGKTFMGVDCSGFVQTVFRVMGIRLKRDASQQVDQGEPVGDIGDARSGDLAFFHNENGRITHVGILLGPGLIAHASGRVRVDPVDAAGIVNKESRLRTHQLHSVRRYF